KLNFRSVATPPAPPFPLTSAGPPSPAEKETLLPRIPETAILPAEIIPPAPPPVDPLSPSPALTSIELPIDGAVTLKLTTFPAAPPAPVKFAAPPPPAENVTEPPIGP